MRDLSLRLCCRPCQKLMPFLTVLLQGGQGRRARHRVHLAVSETVIVLHPPLPLVGVSTGGERERQQNDRTLVNGSRSTSIANNTKFVFDTGTSILAGPTAMVPPHPPLCHAHTERETSSMHVPLRRSKISKSTSTTFVRCK